MYQHPNTHISKQIHTEAYKGALNLKNPKLYKIDILYNLGSSILRIAGFSSGFS